MFLVVLISCLLLSVFAAAATAAPLDGDQSTRPVVAHPELQCGHVSGRVLTGE